MTNNDKKGLMDGLISIFKGTNTKKGNVLTQENSESTYKDVSIEKGIQPETTLIENADQFLSSLSDDNSVGFRNSLFNVFNEDTNQFDIGDLIITYRELANDCEMAIAINTITDEVIVEDDEYSKIVDVDIENEEIDNKLKETIREEWNYLYSKVLNFNEYGREYFERWYIDGRITFQKQISKKSENQNEIKRLVMLDPGKLRRYKDNDTGRVFFIYEPSDFDVFNQFYSNNTDDSAYVLDSDAITYVPSGLVDTQNNVFLSYLHKSIKPFNDLKNLETAMVIYRITRAPERRLFKINTGNMNTKKAEEYIQKLINKYTTKLVYDDSTGQIKSNKNIQNMVEDFWLGESADSKGSNIDILSGGQNLSDIDDIKYFRNKYLKSMNIPLSKFDDESRDNLFLGKTSDLTADDLKFYKFVQKLRKNFSKLFDDLLKTQLILKGVIKPHEWEDIRLNLKYTWNKEHYYYELKKLELLQERISMMRDVEDLKGQYVSKNWIWKNILHFTDEEIEKQKEVIQKEKDEEPEDESSSRW